MNRWVSAARRIAMLVLLFIVFQHSHWSVAFSLLLLSAGHEMNAALWWKLAQTFSNGVARQGVTGKDGRP